MSNVFKASETNSKLSREIESSESHLLSTISILTPSRPEHPFFINRVCRTVTRRSVSFEPLGTDTDVVRSARCGAVAREASPHVAFDRDFGEGERVVVVLLGERREENSEC